MYTKNITSQHILRLPIILFKTLSSIKNGSDEVKCKCDERLRPVRKGTTSSDRGRYVYACANRYNGFFNSVSSTVSSDVREGLL